MSNPNEAREQEATGEGVGVVRFRGREFAIPKHYADWPLELHEALEDGRNIAILRAALGPQQWGQVRMMGLKTDGIDELANAITAAFGLKSVGESATSSD